MSGEVEDYTLRQIGDRVWFDHDADGVFDAGTEAGLAGVTVVLSADLNGDGTLETYATTTDANGFYRFDGVPEGSYTITVTPIATTTPTHDLDGGNDNVTALTIAPATTTNFNVDFGYRGTGIIGDYIWHDQNANGIQDAGEPGLSGVAVQLRGDINGDTVTDITLNTTTSATGLYEFQNLLPGTYAVAVTQPASMNQTFDADGIATPNVSTIVLGSGVTNRLQDFGYTTTPPPSTDVDLIVTKDNNNAADLAAVGGVITYTVSVRNAGPANASSATVTDNLPTQFTGATWTASGTPGTIFTASGSGNLAETVSIPVGGTVTYIVAAQLNSTFTGSVTNTDTVSTTQTDSDLTNNSASDVTNVSQLSLTPENQPLAGKSFQIGARGMSHVALVPFIVGTRLGAGTVNGVAVGVADPFVFMIGFVCVDDRIIGIYDIPANLDGQTLYFQSYESSPTPRLSNIITARVGGPRIVATQSGNVSVVTSFTPTADLEIGKHAVWVRARSSAGEVSAWSTGARIDIRTAPAITAIADGTSRRPTIGWNTVPGAVAYELWVNNQTTGVSRIIHKTSLTGTSFTPTADLGFGIHVAWVRGINKFNQTAGWSAAESFSVASELPGPVGPTFATPPTFTWTALPGAATHEIYIRSGSNIVQQTGLTTNSFTPTSALANGTHRWWIRSYAANGKAGNWSDVAEVTIGGRPSITAPVDSGTVSTTPTFQWTAVTGAARYSLFISGVTATSFTYRNDTLTGNTFTHPTTLAVGTYRAWVRAISTTGSNSAWSVPVTFTVASV